MKKGLITGTAYRLQPGDATMYTLYAFFDGRLGLHAGEIGRGVIGGTLKLGRKTRDLNKFTVLLMEKIEKQIESHKGDPRTNISDAIYEGIKEYQLERGASVPERGYALGAEYSSPFHLFSKDEGVSGYYTHGKNTYMYLFQQGYVFGLPFIGSKDYEVTYTLSKASLISLELTNEDMKKYMISAGLYEE